MTRFGPYARLAGFGGREQTQPAAPTASPPGEERTEAAPEPESEKAGFGLAAVKNILAQYKPTVKRRP